MAAILIGAAVTREVMERNMMPREMREKEKVLNRVNMVSFVRFFIDY